MISSSSTDWEIWTWSQLPTLLRHKLQSKMAHFEALGSARVYTTIRNQYRIPILCINIFLTKGFDVKRTPILSTADGAWPRSPVARRHEMFWGDPKWEPNRTKLQTSLDHLSTFCASNKLMVNISNTKAMTFRRGGRMSTDDKLSYNGSPLEFLSSFTYLGVVFQTRGGTGGHTDHLRSKGLSSCGKISTRLPLSKLSLPSLERLFLSIVLPSMSYALGTLIQLNPNLTYIDEIQGRLLKMWFGVS